MCSVNKASKRSVSFAVKEDGARILNISLVVVINILAVIRGDGAGAFEVELRAPSFVIRGGSALLKCDHGVDTRLLHKVEWLKDGDTKLFQFVRGRNPPYRNFTTPGATLDWNRSNEKEIYLTGLDLEASGVYSCEVSMETPIYTKPSNDEVITVIQQQSDDPELWGVRTSYFVGESLEVNCTSTPSHPPAHITWLVNGRQVSDQSLTWFPGSAIRHYQRVHGGHHQRPFRAQTSDEGEELLLADEGTEVGDQGVEKIAGGSTEDDGGGGGYRDEGGGAVAVTEGTAAVQGGKGGEGSSAVSGDGLDPDRDSDSPDIVPLVTTAPSSSTVQLSFQLSDRIVRTLAEDSEVTSGPKRSEVKIRLILTCIATIPDFIGPDHEYADRRLTSFAVDIISPISGDSSSLFGSASGLKPWNIMLALLLTLVILLFPQPLTIFPATAAPSTESYGSPVVLPHIFLHFKPFKPRR